jgi:hypothetical protein
MYKCTLEVGGMIITFLHAEIVNCHVNKLHIYWIRKLYEMHKCTLEVGGIIITFLHAEIVNCHVNKLHIY